MNHARLGTKTARLAAICSVDTDAIIDRDRRERLCLMTNVIFNRDGSIYRELVLENEHRYSGFSDSFDWALSKWAIRFSIPGQRLVSICHPRREP